MQYPPAAMGCFKSKRITAAIRSIKPYPVALQRRDGKRRIPEDRTDNGRVAETVTRSKRVGKMQAWTVIVAQTCCNPALGERAGGFGSQWRSGKQDHRLRVIVASGAHPRFARNTGTDEPFGEATKLVPADIEIFHDPVHPTALHLPVHEI